MPLLEKPDPATAGTVDDLVERLRLLKIWAGDPSYETIKDRVNAAWTAAGRPAGELTSRSTVANCFVPGRRRLNNDLVLGVVQALNPDEAYVSQWRQALRVIGGEIEAVSQVRVQDTLPADLPEFTGRTGELGRLRVAEPVSVVEGMAGVGKTRLAVHAGHQLVRERAVERVLFVNLRGFHPDPSQPPADPSAVLDGFLRLLGVPSHLIPHGEAALAAAYRDRLAARRTLVVLDDAATAEQVRPLLPATPGCLALITSRRRLDGLSASRLGVDVFTPAEAAGFLTAAADGVPVGPDPRAAARIAGRCGHLPLALSLIAGHIRGTPDWTLTDHADRLDERHRDRRLDSGVELAFDLSYRHLPAGRQRLLRLTALHPGQDIDAYAAAALAGVDLGTARAGLDQLCRDHLLQATAPGRYTFHDLVRDYATSRAHDEDRPAERRDALTRLFDYYLAAAAGAMDTVNPVDKHVAPLGADIPDLSEPDAAVTWLNTERPTLIAMAGYTATHGWPAHTTRLARTIYMYLTSGHQNDGARVHGYAHQAAVIMGDTAAQARALTDQAIMYLHWGEMATGVEQLHRALALYGPDGHPEEQGRILNNLADVEERGGRHDIAIAYQERALALCRKAGDRNGESRALCGLGILEERAGRYESAGAYYQQAVELARQAGSRSGEANMLNGLGGIEMRLGRHDAAERYLGEGLALSRRFGLRVRQAEILDSIAILHVTMGRLDQAADEFGQALHIYEEVGDRDGVAWSLNGLGEVAGRSGRHADAVQRHTAAHAVAAEVNDRTQQARAFAGLGRAHRALGDEGTARDNFEKALQLYAAAGMPEADEIRELLQ
jgi:tetratricopeptide (TPR) repeat protein